MAELYLELRVSVVEAAGVTLDATTRCETRETASARVVARIYKNWHIESCRTSRWSGSEAHDAISAGFRLMRDAAAGSSFARFSRHWTLTTGSR